MKSIFSSLTFPLFENRIACGTKVKQILITLFQNKKRSGIVRRGRVKYDMHTLILPAPSPKLRVCCCVISSASQQLDKYKKTKKTLVSGLLCLVSTLNQFKKTYKNFNTNAPLVCIYTCTEFVYSNRKCREFIVLKQIDVMMTSVLKN